MLMMYPGRFPGADFLLFSRGVSGAQVLEEGLLLLQLDQQD